LIVSDGLNIDWFTRKTTSSTVEPMLVHAPVLPMVR
jgi:hypothetical protein